MLRKFLSLMISLSMLTAAVPAAFAAPDMADCESTETAAEVMETEVPDDAVEVSDKETETTELETADIVETVVHEETETAAETDTPEETTETAAETDASEETTETAAEPGISLMSVVDSGTCGENLTWTLDDSGTLTISGTGAMNEYDSWRDSPFDYNDDITSVVIEEGVTSIGSWAFVGCSALTGVYYNNNFSEFAKISIGENNSELTDATLHCGDATYETWGKCGSSLAYYLDSGTLTISGAGAMTNYGSPNYSGSNLPSWYSIRSSIKAVVIEDGVTSVGDHAFYNCTSLTSVTLGNGVASIGSWAFGNSALTSVTIPANITSIGDSAFYGCDALVDIYYNSNYCDFGENVFGYCDALTDIYFNGNFSDFANIYIGYNYQNPFAFSEKTVLHCSDTTYSDWGRCGYTMAYFIDATRTLTIIGTGAMTNYSPNAPWFSKSITSVVIENGVTSIGEDAFSFCSALTSITIPDSIVSIGSFAFERCEALDSVYISDLAAYLNTSFESGGSTNPMYYADKLYLNNRRVSGDLMIPEGVTNIPTYAFDGCDGITSVTIPDSVTGIGAHAFNNCSRLENAYIEDLSKWCAVSFGDSSANPLYYAENLYLNDELLTDIVIPNGTVSIGNYAFNSYDKLSTVTIPESVTFIGKDAFNMCSGITDVYINDLTKWCEIEFDNAYANPLYYANNFYVNNDLITEIVIPDGVTAIRNFAFYNFDNMSDITIPDTVTSIGFSAFYSCDSLNNITIPDSIVTIDSNAFNDCDALDNVIIPNSITSIGGGAFFGCDGLTTLSIGSGLTSVGLGAFYNCPNLTTVYCNMSKISADLFGGLYGYSYYSNNAALVILGDNVTSIDTDAFLYCYELRKIFIPKSVMEIENSAFKNCTNLAIVEYGGSQEDWEQVYIGDNNDNLLNAQINYNSLAEDAALTDTDLLTYTINDNGTITITNCYENAVDIDIPAEINGMPVTAINSSAFANRAKLESVTIPSSVTTIGDRTFYGCTGLTEITIPDSVSSIGDSTFYNCTGLNSITIPASVTSIERYAFYGCSSLTDVYYAGTEEQWNAVLKGYSNDPLTNANIYYNGTKPELEPTPLPMTTAEITKTDTETGYVFEVTPETAYENCFVYAAVYDENGVLIALSQVPLSTGGSTSIEVGRSENDSRAAVFVWADTLQPIVTKAEFSLI